VGRTGFRGRGDRRGPTDGVARCRAHGRRGIPNRFRDSGHAYRFNSSLRRYVIHYTSCLHRCSCHFPPLLYKQRTNSRSCLTSALSSEGAERNGSDACVLGRRIADVVVSSRRGSLGGSSESESLAARSEPISVPTRKVCRCPPPPPLTRMRQVMRRWCHTECYS